MKEQNAIPMHFSCLFGGECIGIKRMNPIPMYKGNSS